MFLKSVKQFRFNKFNIFFNYLIDLYALKRLFALHYDELRKTKTYIKYIFLNQK